MDSEKLIELKREGVSENIILAMLSHDESFVGSGDDWTDDASFRGSLKRPKDVEGQKNSGDSGSDIWGSGQSSKSQSGGRGMNGADQLESTTTGSATVRILRPPSEGGSAALKLEKTATLNNDAVIRLVEAGFSEGTIIKRIEDSPADFDLSNSKLAELRRRRVTEPIIDAMMAAMSDDSGAKEVAPPRAKGN